jgi:hypothetical protein
MEKLMRLLPLVLKLNTTLRMTTTSLNVDSVGLLAPLTTILYFHHAIAQDLLGSFISTALKVGLMLKSNAKLVSPSHLSTGSHSSAKFVRRLTHWLSGVRIAIGPTT